MPSQEIIQPKTTEAAGGFLAAQDAHGNLVVASAQEQRERAEIESAITVAKRFPRDESKAYTKMMNSAKRPAFAEKARYVFPRGGADVSGPSVQLAREAARCWENLRYGIRVLAIYRDQRDNERVHIAGWCWDLETNAAVQVEDDFANLIYRKKGGWQKPDERDFRELVNRRGAICVRNAILQVLPPDMIDEMERESAKTLQAAARGDLEQNREDRIRRMVRAFSEFGVTPEAMSAKLGHELKTLTPEELAEMTGIYVSIRDGQSKVSDHFSGKTGAGEREEATVTAEAHADGSGGITAGEPTGERGGSTETAPKPEPRTPDADLLPPGAGEEAPAAGQSEQPEAPDEGDPSDEAFRQELLDEIGDLRKSWMAAKKKDSVAWRGVIVESTGNAKGEMKALDLDQLKRLRDRAKADLGVK